MGFPIRKSADQRLFAPPHSLSQRTTSFIASQRQGIHRIPLLHLIALIINIHPLKDLGRDLQKELNLIQQGYDRKDQFCFKHARERAVRRRPSGKLKIDGNASPQRPESPGSTHADVGLNRCMLPLYDVRYHLRTRPKAMRNLDIKDECVSCQS